MLKIGTSVDLLKNVVNQVRSFGYVSTDFMPYSKKQIEYDEFKSLNRKLGDLRVIINEYKEKNYTLDNIVSVIKNQNEMLKQRLVSSRACVSAFFQSLYPKKKIANEQENALLTAFSMKKNGIDNFALVGMNTPRNKEDHVFIVVDLAENANLSNPKTWGDDSKIVNSELGIVKYVFEDKKTSFIPFFKNNEQPLNWLLEKFNITKKEPVSFFNYLRKENFSDNILKEYDWETKTLYKT